MSYAIRLSSGHFTIENTSFAWRIVPMGRGNGGKTRGVDISKHHTKQSDLAFPSLHATTDNGREMTTVNGKSYSHGFLIMGRSSGGQAESLRLTPEGQKRASQVAGSCD